MKKKVVIQGLPNKSSKKKVVIEGLPKAEWGAQWNTLVPQPETVTQPPSNLQAQNVVMPEYQVAQNQQVMTQAPTILTEPESTSKKKGTTRLKGIGMPTSSNPYINRGLTYAGQAMGHFSNASRLKKGETMKPEDYYQSSYFGPMSTGLQFEVEKAQFGALVGNTLGSLPNMMTPGLSQFSNATPEAQQNFMGALNLTQSVGNIAKGITDEVGTNLLNRQELGRNARQYSQAVANSAQNVTPYETQGYDFLGRNALAADGMQIRQIGGMGEPNVEVEGKEHIKLPNGFSQEIKGKSHAEGGIPLNLPQGSKIFSEKLKDPETKKSYADLAKKYETKKYIDLLNKKTADPIQKATAQMMIQKNNQKLEELFALQEQNKASGLHGIEVQQNALREQQAQQQQQPEEPMMMHGGYHLHKAQDGEETYYGQTTRTPETVDYMPPMPASQIRSTDLPSLNPFGTFAQTPSFIFRNTPEYKKYIDNITKETGFNIENKPTWQQRDLGEWDKAKGLRIGDLALDPTVRKYYENLPGKDVPAALYQEYMYDEYLDKMENGSPEEKEAALQGMRKMWKEAGSTNAGLALGLKTKGIDLDKAGYEEFNKLRPSFIDARGQYRYLEPFKGPQPQAPTTTPTTETPAKKDEAKPEAPPQKPADVIKNQDVYANLAFNIPRNYAMDPLNYYALQPEFIQPRYLDIQPQLNRITRGQRALQSTLGSRGASDTANLLAAQANRAAAEQEAFGQKYNYDRQQDAAAQEFNARAKMDMDRYNQGSWFQQLEDPIRRRGAAITEQKMLDQARAEENARASNAYLANKKIAEGFYPSKNLTGQDLLASLNLLAPLLKSQTAQATETKKDETETKLPGEKYGGKVKKKMKIKPKIKYSYF